MRILTDEEKIEIANRPKYEALKTTLLKEYKGYQESLDYADDEFEEGLIIQKREKLAVKIRELGEKIREINSLDSLS